MSLVDYGRIIIQRGWIIVLLAAIIAGSAYFFSARQTPIYRATQKVLIVPSRMDLGLAEAALRLLNNNAEYLRSSLIAAEVIERLQLEYEPGFLLSRTTIAPDRDNLIIQIDVDLEDPQIAERVALEWGNMLIEYRNEENQRAGREDWIRARLQDNPTTSLLSPRPLINAIAGAVLGVLLGGVIIFVLEYLESSVVRRREDLERSLDMAVLASIPRLEG